MRIAPVRIDCPAPHGRLESLVQEPESPVAVAVVCHPHPLHGGTMNNNVVYRVARTLFEAGLATMRFNFRGVEGSTGEYGGGVGEEEDVLAALAFMAERHPGLPMWIAGFSFGSRVGLSVGARDPRVVKLLGVGLALTLFDFSFLADSAKPKAFIQAENDEFGSAAEVEALVARMREPKRFASVPGATHLFPGKLPALEQELAKTVAWLAAR